MPSGTTKVAALIGYPVSHSLSPALHGHWLRFYEIDGIYIPMPLTIQDFSSAFPALPKLGLVGCNITIPHKEQVMLHADHIDETARAIGAANTVTFDQGVIHAANTDAYGFQMSLQQADPDWKKRRGSALVLGSGGAARAIVYSLLQSQLGEIRLANRTRAKAEAILRHFADPRLKVIGWEEIPHCLTASELLINTTSLGMRGQPPLELDIAPLPPHALVADIVYKPLLTPLLQQAQSLHLKTADGLDMLLYQAQEGFHRWFGQRPEVTETLRQHLLSLL